MSASALYLASIPSPDRGVWELGPIPIRAYALCIIAGIIVAIWWSERRWVARGGTAGAVIDIAVFAVPFGLVGGRLYHVATDWHRYFGDDPEANPINALKIWDGGLGIWGAIAFGAVGAWIGCRAKGVPLPAFADAVAPGIVVAQAIGRLGNYFNQELTGGPTDLPWGLEIYRRVNEFGVTDNLNGVAENHIPVEIVHPAFLYELLWNLAVAGVVVWLDRKLRLGHGRAFAVYVAGYTLGRTWIELMRTDTATLVFDVRVNVWVSGLVFIGAVAYFFLARSRGEREDPALLVGKDGPAAAADEPAKSDTDDADDTDGTASDTDEESDETDEDTDADTDAESDDVDKPDTDEKADSDEEKAEPATSPTREP